MKQIKIHVINSSNYVATVLHNTHYQYHCLFYTWNDMYQYRVMIETASPAVLSDNRISLRKKDTIPYNVRTEQD